MDIGFLYDGTTGEDDDFFIAASAIAQTGGQLHWPSAATSLNIGTSIVTTGPGYLSITTGGGSTTTLGDIEVLAKFTYDSKDVA